MIHPTYIPLKKLYESQHYEDANCSANEVWPIGQLNVTFMLCKGCVEWILEEKNVNFQSLILP